MSKFLQWNCRGYYPNFEELGRLIELHTPKAICLQELQLRNRAFLPPSKYRLPLASQNRGANDRGSAAILFHESVPFTHIPIPTRLHAVAARVHLDSPFTLCSVYLAPSCIYTREDLFGLFRNLPPPLLVLGDFNIRHPLWGDSVSSPNADWLLGVLQGFSLGCLNTGLPTFERFDTRTSSCVDISLCSLSFIDKFWWDRSPYLCGSDHYPIYILHLFALIVLRCLIPAGVMTGLIGPPFSLLLMSPAFRPLTSFLPLRMRSHILRMLFWRRRRPISLALLHVVVLLHRGGTQIALGLIVLNVNSIAHA